MVFIKYRLRASSYHYYSSIVCMDDYSSCMILLKQKRLNINLKLLSSWTASRKRSWPNALLPQNPPKIFPDCSKHLPNPFTQNRGLEALWGVLATSRAILNRLGEILAITGKSSQNLPTPMQQPPEEEKSDQHLHIIHPLDASWLRLRDVLEVYWMRLGMRLEKILGRLETYKKNWKFWSEGINHDPKILPEFSQNPPEIFTKLSKIVQNPGLETPWGVLATSWCILARLGNILGRLEPILGRLG